MRRGSNGAHPGPISSPRRGAARAGWCCSPPPRGARPYTDFTYQSGDTLLFGQESAGVPEFVHEAADARLIIPIAAETRSLNLVAAAAMALGEALRQTGGFP